MSADENRECDSCTYFDNGHCTAFAPLCVDGEWVCDHFKASGKPDDDSRETPQADQPRTLDAARVRVREHYRRTKASSQQ